MNLVSSASVEGQNYTLSFPIHSFLGCFLLKNSCWGYFLMENRGLEESRVCVCDFVFFTFVSS